MKVNLFIFKWRWQNISPEQARGFLSIYKEREKRQGDKMTNTNIYIFDTAHYLEWCKIWNLNKNNAEVLRLFKSRCDFERVFKEIKKC